MVDALINYKFKKWYYSSMTSQLTDQFCTIRHLLFFHQQQVKSKAIPEFKWLGWGEKDPYKTHERVSQSLMFTPNAFYVPILKCIVLIPLIAT